jgi:hypothetical protein
MFFKKLGTVSKIMVLKEQMTISLTKPLIKKMQTKIHQLFPLSAFLLLANIASSQETKTDNIDLEVHPQPLSALSKIRSPFFNKISFENPAAQSLLVRPKETVYDIKANWSISYMRKQKTNKGRQRLLAAPFHLLGFGLGKSEVMERNKVRRQYPDFVKF